MIEDRLAECDICGYDVFGPRGPNCEEETLEQVIEDGWIQVKTKEWTIIVCCGCKGAYKFGDKPIEWGKKK